MRRFIGLRGCWKLGKIHGLSPRRIAILASEDIGNADPQALVVASAAYDIVERIGMPEAQLTLGQAAIYMAMAPKSNASAWPSGAQCRM